MNPYPQLCLIDHALLTYEKKTYIIFFKRQEYTAVIYLFSNQSTSRIIHIMNVMLKKYNVFDSSDNSTRQNGRGITLSA